MLNALLGEFTNINSIYQSYETTIQTAIQLIRTEPFLDKLTTSDNPQPQRSLLPSLGDTLQWLTGTATMKDTTDIKQQVDFLMQDQAHQQETLVHIISILNITKYVTQVNRQKINEVMHTFQKANEDMNILFNITDILMQHLIYQYTLIPTLYWPTSGIASHA